MPAPRDDRGCVPTTGKARGLTTVGAGAVVVLLVAVVSATASDDFVAGTPPVTGGIGMATASVVVAAAAAVGALVSAGDWNAMRALARPERTVPAFPTSGAGNC